MWSISRRQAFVATLVLAAVLLTAGRLLVRTGTPAAADPAPVVETAPAVQPRLVVDVSGAVRRPGLYRLPQGSRIADAVSRAGGATARADLESINLAAPLGDGQKVLVPRKAAPGAGTATGTSAEGSAGGPVSLSTATLEELDALPGVGPVTAQKILDYREQHGGFRSVDELDAVPGIGPARLDELRDLVTP